MIHTPGTWEVGEPYVSDCGRYEYTPIMSGDIIVASLYMGNGYGDSATFKRADANLIAAAPDLLAALKMADCGIEELCFGQNEENECWNILRTVRAAIAKAEAVNKKG